MRIEPEISEAAIVLIGSFNPKIFQPYWFAKHGLLSEEEAHTAELSIVHPQIAEFKIESFHLRVDQLRFAIDRAVAPLIVISDLVGRIFGDLLPHTPISAMGINRMVHFDVGDSEKRDHIGEMLAPKAPWGAWGEQAYSGEGNKHGGMLSLLLIQRNVTDREAGWIQTRIEPSARIRSGQTGIFMEVTDHYQTTEGTETMSSEYLLKILQERFDRSLKNSDTIINHIMSLKP